MHIDALAFPAVEFKGSAYRPRRTLSDRLQDTLLSLADGKGRIVAHEEKAWASITFAGTRHTLTIEFEGCDAIAAGEQLIEVLPDYEFNIPGQLVAEANVDAVNHTLHPAPGMVVTLVLLLLEEA